MSTELKVTIITATYNSEAFLETTIKSVLSQTYPNIEYIIIDGASTDGTLEIVEKYKSSIAKLVSEPDEGIHYALNKGFKLAQGDIVFLLASDDYLADNRVVEDVVKTFDADPSLLFVYGMLKMFDPMFGDYHVTGKEVYLDAYQKSRLSDSDCAQTLYPQIPAFFFKRSAYDELGGFDEQYRIAADIDLLIRYFKRYSQQSRFLKRIVTCFREGGISSRLTTRNIGQMEAAKILNEHFHLNLVIDEPNVLDYYRLWVHLFTVYNQTMSDIVRHLGYSRVAIYGTRKTSMLLFRDFLNGGLQVKCFLDRDESRKGDLVDGVSVHLPDWLDGNYHEIDVVVVSIDGNHDRAVVEQLKQQIGKKPIAVLSWKDLLEIRPV